MPHMFSEFPASDQSSCNDISPLSIFQRARTTILWIVLTLLFVGLPGISSAESPTHITVVHSASYVPYSYLNTNGEPEGILIDLWRLFAEKNNVEITFKLVNWSESLELIKQGEVDIHGGLTVSENREAYIYFADEILNIRTLLFVPITSDKSELAEFFDEPVGVIASTFDEDFIQTHFPQVHLVTYLNSEEMIDAAVRKEIHAFVADYPSGYYRLLLVDELDRFHATSTLYTESIHAAVAQGSDSLRDFVNAGFKKLTSAEIRTITDHWLIPPKPKPKWLIPALFGGGVTFILIIMVSHYWSLRRLVRVRTHELHKKIEELVEAKAQAERLATTDRLTGIGNRRAFYDKVAVEIERTSRYPRPLCLVLFDLDDFKSINDNFGHPAGDSALTEFVITIQRRLRKVDFFARLGGDEFAVLLPETSKDKAVSLVSRMLEDVRNHKFDHNGIHISTSFSAGVAEYQNDLSVDDWIHRGDSLLYKGKSEGRARVIGG